MPTKAHKPLPEDSNFFYRVYKDHYQGIIKKRARRSKHPVTKFKNIRMILHPDLIPVNKRCGAWPYCDREIRDNDWDVACSIHWFSLREELRIEVKAVLNLPKKSRVRKIVIDRIKERLQLAGKRGEVMRAHMREYAVVDNREG